VDIADRIGPMGGVRAASMPSTSACAIARFRVAWFAALWIAFCGSLSACGGAALAWPMATPCMFRGFSLEPGSGF
jgi:hypothetical protein